MRRFVRMVVGAALLSLVSGCAPDATGEWEGRDKVAGERNELRVEDDGGGKAKIYFYAGDNAYYADFDLRWEDRGDDRYEFEMDCDGCDDDFTMDCDMGEDTMECSGDNEWKKYDFEWQRVN